MITPINKHIQVLPLKQESFISSPENVYEEKGKVLAIADDCTKVKVGMIVYFDSWLVARFENMDKQLIYLVPEEAIRAIEIPVSSLPDAT